MARADHPEASAARRDGGCGDSPTTAGTRLVCLVVMPGNSREMITIAERRFPVRIRIGVLPGGFGQHQTDMTAWLDENCGADCWAMTPSGTRGVLNDAVSIFGASNFFELAVAAAIALFGFQSGAALATVVGVLVEVPVMLSVVRIVLRTRGRCWSE
jgi:hypothetical protein